VSAVVASPSGAASDVRLPVDFQTSDIPEIPTESLDACPVCGGDRHDLLTEGLDYELRTCRNVWRFVRCRACGHVWLNPRPAVSALKVIYPPTYYAYNYTSEVSSIAARGKEIMDAFKLRWVLKQLPRPATSYLDIGCGDGRYLKVMEKQGIPRDHLWGLELDPRPLESLAAAGYRVFCERVESADMIADRSIDVATMFHVIEHVDDPKRVVRKIASWLAPGGVLAIETPNIDSLDARRFSNHYWGGYHIPRHWNLFTPSTLERLLRDGGLEPFAVQYQTGHAFWMYSFHHALRYRWNRPRLAGYFDPFKGLLPLLAGFTVLDKLRAMLGFKTSGILMLARRRDDAQVAA
jgi:SAM-dependent methyltransferase